MNDLESTANLIRQTSDDYEKIKSEQRFFQNYDVNKGEREYSCRRKRDNFLLSVICGLLSLQVWG